MIDLYYAPTPNGWKITIMLEECNLPYKVIPVNLGKGDQFKPDFLSISPNNRRIFGATPRHCIKIRLRVTFRVSKSIS